MTMAWKEVCTIEERMKFVLAAAAEEDSMATLCDDYGISRKTGYKWLRRYLAEGPVGLPARSTWGIASSVPNSDAGGVSQLAPSSTMSARMMPWARPGQPLHALAAGLSGIPAGAGLFRQFRTAPGTQQW
jgi:transposase-like protein